jgi:hypothetical protein
LADAFARLAEDRELLATLGQNAYDGVRSHYTVRHMAEAAIVAYSRAVSVPA